MLSYANRNNHLQIIEFGYFRIKFENEVTFKVRAVNYEHFLITIKLEFQKAISNRA